MPNVRGLVRVACACCGRPFNARRDQVKVGKGKYCSGCPYPTQSRMRALRIGRAWNFQTKRPRRLADRL